MFRVRAVFGLYLFPAIFVYVFVSGVSVFVSTSVKNMETNVVPLSSVRIRSVFIPNLEHCKLQVDHSTCQSKMMNLYSNMDGSLLWIGRAHV